MKTSHQKGRNLENMKRTENYKNNQKASNKMARSTYLPKGFPSSLGRSPGEGMGTHASILAWGMPTDKGACKLQFIG